MEGDIAPFTHILWWKRAAQVLGGGCSGVLVTLLCAPHPAMGLSTRSPLLASAGLNVVDLFLSHPFPSSHTPMAD